MLENVGEECWGRVVEKTTVEKCCREVLERSVGEECWTRAL